MKLYVLMHIAEKMHQYIYILDYIGIIIEGSLEVKLPTMWIDEKAEMGRGRERRRVEESRSEK